MRSYLFELFAGLLLSVGPYIFMPSFFTLGIGNYTILLRIKIIAIWWSR